MVIYGPEIKVTGQDGPGTKRLITGKYGPRIKVTGHNGSNMHEKVDKKEQKWS